MKNSPQPDIHRTEVTKIVQPRKYHLLTNPSEEKTITNKKGERPKMHTQQHLHQNVGYVLSCWSILENDIA